MNLDSLLDQPKDVVLDYYYQQIDFLKKGIDLTIDFSGENSRFLILVNEQVPSALFDRLSMLSSAKQFSKIKLISQNQNAFSGYGSLSHFRKDIVNGLIFFLDDEISLSLEYKRIPGDNFVQLNNYEKQTSFLFDYLFKCQQIEKKIHLLLKFKKAGPKRLLLEEGLNSNSFMAVGQTSLLEFMKAKVKDKRSSREMLAERLKLFSLNYKSYYNFQDPLYNKQVVNSIKFSPKFDDPYILEQIFHMLDSENSNETLFKNLSIELKNLKEKIQEQSLYLQTEGIRYEI